MATQAGNHGRLIPTTLAPMGTTQTVDWDDGVTQILDLGAATGDVILTLSNPVVGGRYQLKVIQGSPARQLTYPAAVKWLVGDTAPALTTVDGEVTIIDLVFDGTDYFGSVPVAAAGGGIPDPYTPPDGTFNIIGGISVRRPGGAFNSEQFGESAAAIGINSTAVAGAAIGEDSTVVGNAGLIVGDKSSGIGANVNISADMAAFVGRLIIIAANGGAVLGNAGQVFAGHINAVVLGPSGESTAAQRTTIGRVGGISTQLQDLQVSGGFAANGQTPLVAPSVTGSRGGNAALASLLTVLGSIGLITDNTTA